MLVYRCVQLTGPESISLIKSEMSFRLGRCNRG